MKARILCPGPSLNRYTPGDFAGFVIAVNRAALTCACDVWAASDYPMIRNHYEKLPGAPSLLTKRQTYLDIRHRLARFLEVWLVEEIQPTPDVPRWSDKTMTCAIAFAALGLHATDIEVYGYDGVGTKDFDGVAAGEDRTDKRWAEERETFDMLCAWLRARGCEVTRRTSDGAVQ